MSIRRYRRSLRSESNRFVTSIERIDTRLPPRAVGVTGHPTVLFIRSEVRAHVVVRSACFVAGSCIFVIKVAEAIRSHSIAQQQAPLVRRHSVARRRLTRTHAVNRPVLPLTIERTMPRETHEASRVDRWLRPLLAEALGTALLVLLGCGSLLPSASLTQAALAWGSIVLALVATLGPASGAHFNPAVSLGAAIAGRLPWPKAAAYAAVQLLGAVLGYGALIGLHPAAADAPMGSAPAGTFPAPEVDGVRAAAVEALVTGLLVLLCCSLWAQHELNGADVTGPLKVGATISALVFAAGGLTGASLNPVRSVAPALWNNAWRSQWVYWLGPLGGAAVAALLHTYVLQPRAAQQSQPEDVPLNTVQHDKAEA